jgi:hypothetical protein
MLAAASAAESAADLTSETNLSNAAVSPIDATPETKLASP